MFGDIIQRSLDQEAADKQAQLAADADREDHASWRNKFYEGMSGFAHKMENAAPAKGNNPHLDDSVIRDNNGGSEAAPRTTAPPAATRPPLMSQGDKGAMLKDSMSGMGGGLGKAAKGAGGFLRDQVEGGVGGAFVDRMNADTPEGVRQSMPAPMRVAPEIEKAFFGGMEQALVWGKGLGMVQAGVGRTLQPITRFMPEMLKSVFKNAVSVGSLSAGTEALAQRERGESPHDLTETAALGGIIGAAAGYLHPDDMAVLKQPENVKALWQAAGGAGGKSMRELQRVASRMGGDEYSNEVALSKMARFTVGSGDQAVAAKLRNLSRSEPELFKDPLMKKVLAAANRDDAGRRAPAVEKPSPGAVARVFNYPSQKSEVVAHEGAGAVPGAKRGPLGIPLGAADDPAKVPESFKKQPATAGKPATAKKPPTAPSVTTAEGQANLIKGLAERKVGQTETKAGAAARVAVSKLVTEGTLRPEMVTNGAHARGVQMALGETARLLEGKAGYSEHLDAMKAWAKRARELKGAPEIAAAPVDAKSAVELRQLQGEIDGERQVETNPTAPGKTAMTRGMMEKRKSGKPKFC